MPDTGPSAVGQSGVSVAPPPENVSKMTNCVSPTTVPCQSTSAPPSESVSPKLTAIWSSKLNADTVDGNAHVPVPLPLPEPEPEPEPEPVPLSSVTVVSYDCEVTTVVHPSGSATSEPSLPMSTCVYVTFVAVPTTLAFAVSLACVNVIAPEVAR